MRILQNKAARATIHFTANATVNVAGASSDLKGSNNETITGASIIRATWGCAPAAYWTVKRGSNTVAVYSTTGQMIQESINLDPAAVIDIKLEGTGPGFLVLELRKEGKYANSQYFGNWQGTHETPL